jgi:hypothetical protein
MGRFACRCAERLNDGMAPRFLTILTGRNLPKNPAVERGRAVDHQRKDDADFTLVVDGPSADVGMGMR